jgi:hypothetical protein
VSLLPALVLAVGLVPWNAALSLAAVALPLARAQLGGNAAGRGSRPGRAAWLVGSRAERWALSVGRLRPACVARAFAAVALFALGDTTATWIAARQGEARGPGATLVRSVAFGGDPDLAAPLALMIALAWLAARAFGLRIAWYGATPSRTAGS